MNKIPETLLEEAYGLGRPNFILDPAADWRCFARRDINVGSIVEGLQVDLVTRLAPKRLMWGPYGGGKTHTLYRALHELGELTPIHPVRVECPDLAKKSTFNDLYRDGIMPVLGEDAVVGLFERAIEQGGANGLGPNLWATMGKPHGHVAGFAYSDALKAVPGVWDWQGMDKWLTSPRAYAPGTKMTFAGLGNPQDRANLIAYMNSMGTNLPLPAAPAATPAEGDKAAAEGIPIVDLMAADWAGIDTLVLSPGIPHTFPKPHPIAGE